MQRKVLILAEVGICILGVSAFAKEITIKDPEQQNNCSNIEYTKPTSRAVINTGSNAAVSPPSLSKDGHIFVGGSGTDYYKISKDGKTKVTIPADDLFNKSAAHLEDGTTLLPCINGKIYGYENGRKYLFTQVNGRPRSVFATKNKSGKEIVLVSNSVGEFQILDNQGQVLCTYQSRGKQRKEDKIGFGTITKDKNGNYLVGSAENRLYVISENCTEVIDPINTSGDVDTANMFEDGNIRFGSYDENIYTLGTDYKLISKKAAGGAIGGSIVAYPPNPSLPNGGYVFANGKGELRIVDKDGKDIVVPIDVTGGQPIYSTPVIMPNGLIAVGGNDKKMHFYTPDGKLVSTFKADGEIQSDPLALDDGGIVFNTRHGNIYIVNGPQPKGNVGDVNKSCSTNSSSKVVENFTANKNAVTVSGTNKNQTEEQAK